FDGDGDFLELRIVRLQKSLALAVDADASGDEVGFARLDIAIAFGARDAAGLFEPLDGLLQVLLTVGRQPQLPEQFRHVRGRVIPSGKQIQNLFFHNLVRMSRSPERNPTSVKATLLPSMPDFHRMTSADSRPWCNAVSERDASGAAMRGFRRKPMGQFRKGWHVSR